MTVTDVEENGIPLPMALAAVWGAFLYEGLLAHPISHRNQLVLDSWGQGCIELIMALCTHLPEIWLQISTTWNNTDSDFPGVFEYEVVSELGDYFAQYLLAHNGELPDTMLVKHRISMLIQNFFLTKAA